MAYMPRLAKQLENAFFFKQDRELLDAREELLNMEANRKAMREVSGIKSAAVLDKLVELGVTPEVLAMLALVPLIEVAWADGHVHKDEKEAILKAMAEIGFAKCTLDHVLLERWLSHKPSPKLLEAWKHYVQGLCEEFTPAECARLKERMMANAREVAEAAGGFMGLVSPITPGEKKVLDRLEKAFPVSA